MPRTRVAHALFAERRLALVLADDFVIGDVVRVAAFQGAGAGRAEEAA